MKLLPSKSCFFLYFMPFKLLHDIFMLKILSMVVCYYHADLRIKMVEHLGSLEILKVDAGSLEKVFCEFVLKNNITY